MKVREANKSANSRQRARQVARQNAEIADLKAQLTAALQRIDKLEQENARLKQELAAARKNSSNSSKPPSSDIAHLIRDVKYLATLSGKGAKAQGQRTLSSFSSKDFGQEGFVPGTMSSLHGNAFLTGMLFQKR